MSALPILYDCDPGNDDALGILVACGHATLDLKAVTTGAGHLSSEGTAINAAIAVAVAGRTDVPVSAGASNPLLRERLIAQLLDKDGGLDFSRPDLPRVPLDPRHSADVMDDVAVACPGLTIVCTGPLTNLALALRRHDKLANRIRRIVTLGGAWGLGNKTAAAEWNVLCDPEAAAIVYQSGIPITMIPVEASGAVPIDDELAAGAKAISGMVGTLAADLMTSLRNVHRTPLMGPPETPLHDPCALLVTANPALARTTPARVDIELAGRHTYGRSVIDFHGRSGPANADVVLSLDVQATRDALLAAIRRAAAGNDPGEWNKHMEEG